MPLHVDQWILSSYIHIGLCTVPARLVQHGRSLMPVWHPDLQPEKITIRQSSNGLATIDQQPYSRLCYINSCMSNARVALIHNHRSDNDPGGDVLTLWDTWAILSHKAWCPSLGNAKPVSTWDTEKGQTCKKVQLKPQARRGGRQEGRQGRSAAACRRGPPRPAGRTWYLHCAFCHQVKVGWDKVVQVCGQLFTEKRGKTDFTHLGKCRAEEEGLRMWDPPFPENLEQFLDWELLIVFNVSVVTSHSVQGLLTGLKRHVEGIVAAQELVVQLDVLLHLLENHHHLPHRQGNYHLLDHTEWLTEGGVWWVDAARDYKTTAISSSSFGIGVSQPWVLPRVLTLPSMSSIWARDLPMMSCSLPE